jgi:hypothetical protein
MVEEERSARVDERPITPCLSLPHLFLVHTPFLPSPIHPLSLPLGRQMLGSFIQSQKYSVHKTMERRFKRYLTFGSDYHQLILSLLNQLLVEVKHDVMLQGLVLAEEETYNIPVR